MYLQDETKTAGREKTVNHAVRVAKSAGGVRVLKAVLEFAVGNARAAPRNADYEGSEFFVKESKMRRPTCAQVSPTAA